jgi:predicted tellurium resistance membrane protein TerC
MLLQARGYRGRGPAQIAPGLLVLIMIEVANVLFAVDSIPAIFGIMASLRNS